MRFAFVTTALMLLAPAAAFAQAGPTQSRDGLGAGAHPGLSSQNSLPAGSENAGSGPQARPAYPSGSSSSNPGAAFTRNQPKPATGALASPPGALSTTTVQGKRSTTHPGGARGITEPAAPAR